MQRTEELIMSSLIHNEDYMRKVIPYIDKEYFLDQTDAMVFTEIKRFIEKYNSRPSPEALTIVFTNKDTISDEQLGRAIDLITLIKEADKPQDMSFLVETTEKFCQERAVYNAIQSSINIIDGRDKRTRDAIPDILQDALRVSFDLNVGHDFIDDADRRFDFYHNVEERIPTDVEYFDKITMGGFPKKTLNAFLSGCVHPDTMVKVRLRRRVA